MKYDIILCGVGGQGVLSVAAILALGAQKAGLKVRQAEVHGMSQRGGAVISHFRMAKDKIHSDLVPKGGADLVLSMEELEGLRYLDFLKTDGWLVSSSEKVENIPNYPDDAWFTAQQKDIECLQLIPCRDLAKEAGSLRASNMVLIGAATARLPIEAEILKKSIEEKFSSKGSEIVEINLKAFDLGYKAGKE